MASTCMYVCFALFGCAVVLKMALWQAWVLPRYPQGSVSCVGFTAAPTISYASFSGSGGDTPASVPL